MKAVTRLFLLNEENEKFFGEGPYRLLMKVEETGSLHAAAMSMGMAYSKATKLLHAAEQSLGVPLTVRKIGGKSGGGSALTEEAKDFLTRYEAYRNACVEHNNSLFHRYFGASAGEFRFGCVIMASGLGKRFGGNKLMEELKGKPMIQYILEATEGLFCKRVVVTRNTDVKNWCEERGIPVVYHSLPDRNDTIRLGLEAVENLATEGECDGNLKGNFDGNLKGNSDGNLKGNSDGRLSGCVFCPADMPCVNRNSLREMLFEAGQRQEGIIRMAYGEEVGAPVLFWKDYFEALKTLPKGKGGREIIRENPEKLYYVEAKKECELWDVDTREDFEKINQNIP